MGIPEHFAFYAWEKSPKPGLSTSQRMDALPDGSRRRKVEVVLPRLETRKNNKIMPRISTTIVDRIQTFRTSWRELAPDATFAGMTLTQFEVASAAPLTLRDEIMALEKQTEGKKTERLMADVTAGEMLDLVVNSVRGTPGFGQDCSLYRAFGYVRKSDRKSGLTRKGTQPAVDANAA